LQFEFDASGNFVGKVVQKGSERSDILSSDVRHFESLLGDGLGCRNPASDPIEDVFAFVGGLNQRRMCSVRTQLFANTLD
jgi:hypothetical protein